MTGRRPRSTDRMVPGTRRFQLRSPPPKKFPHRVITTGVPYVSANARLMRSAQDLLTSYGCRPARRASSVHAGGAAPYALSEDATTTWRTVGERRQASSVTHVPRAAVAPRHHHAVDVTGAGQTTVGDVVTDETDNVCTLVGEARHQPPAN